MKLTFPHGEGDLITIYQDWENEKDPIGTAKLVKRTKFGRSFILKEMMPETSQEVFNYEEWIVEWPEDPDPPMFPYLSGPVQTVQKIRYMDMIGISNSKDDEEYEDDEAVKKLQVDKFISIHNIEVY